jgi:cell division septal protein FtsQ
VSAGSGRAGTRPAKGAGQKVRSVRRAATNAAARAAARAPSRAKPKATGTTRKVSGTGRTATSTRRPHSKPAQGRATRIDPRISARRTAVMKEQGRHRLRVVGLGLAGAAILVGAWFLLHTPLFGARAITVTGNVHETTAQVVSQAGLGSHPPLLDVDAGAAAARVEQLPWVRSASVRVSWPDGVHIAVTEETTRFVTRSGANWAEVGSDGRVLGVSAARPDGPVLLSVPQPPGAPGTVLPARDAAGLRVASTLPASFAAQVTAVTVEPAGWVQLALTTPVLVDVGSATELTAKYEDISSILAGATLHAGDVIDVSVPDAPTVTAG